VGAQLGQEPEQIRAEIAVGGHMSSLCLEADSSAGNHRGFLPSR
jgi:hypothetical protein